MFLLGCGEDQDVITSQIICSELFFLFLSKICIGCTCTYSKLLYEMF